MGPKYVRRELIFSVWARYDADEVASFLLKLAEEVACSTTRLLRGEVMEGKPLIATARATSVHAAIQRFGPMGFTYWKTLPRTQPWSGCYLLTTRQPML
jgi:acyl-CoA reductase-like NAD-dependent aldehyde dehydrogenase